MSKPLIRHCRNCEYAKKPYASSSIICDVKYKTIYEEWQRFKACMCGYYKVKEGESDEKIY